MKIIRLILFFALLTAAICLACLGAHAEGADSPSESVLVMAHRGDTFGYPPNSAEAVLSAAEKGADFVSVCARRTEDGVFVAVDDSMGLSAVCDCTALSCAELTYDEINKIRFLSADKAATDFTVSSIETIIERLDGAATLVIDCDLSQAPALYELISSCGALDCTALRFSASSKKAAALLNDCPGLQVVAVSKTNVIFSVLSHLRRLTDCGQTAVEFVSKNYFSVSFGRFAAERYLQSGAARVVAAMYSPDLCGQRDDCASDWDEMIALGFSVIETNCLDSFLSYRMALEASRERLEAASRNARALSAQGYSQAGLERLSKAASNAEATLGLRYASLSQLDSTYSSLMQALGTISVGGASDSSKGSLNVTAGKIAAAVLCGAVILAGEIFVFKMRRPKKGSER